MGYYRAGFGEITGVDLHSQKNYPFPYFIQGDALDFLATVKFGEYDLIHASPPCQGYSRMRHLPWLKGREYPKLIDVTRVALEKIGTPWVIENVVDAPMHSGIMLCGTSFGAKMFRHRTFESSQMLFAPEHRKHTGVIAPGKCSLAKRTGGASKGWVSVGGGGGNQERWDAASIAMGIDWMTRKELSQAIPPAYTEYVGRQLIASGLFAAQP